MTALDMFPETKAAPVPAEDQNRRYTPRAFMEWIRAKAGVESFDLDPAADEESHHAPRWFSVSEMPGSAGVDGLAQSWFWEPIHEHFALCPECADYGLCTAKPAQWKIFINPPFDDLEAWVAKTWDTLRTAALLDADLRIAFVLPGNRHEQPFWQEHIEPFRDGRATRFGYRLDCHFPPGRQAYAKPGSNGVPVGSADFPSCLLVWRRA